jgi:peptidoglycan/LPS O-acetylase OafA/YrhL
MGIRAVAISLVILDHWTLGPFAFGEMGQLIFLVLSGYLISGLVWKNEIYWGATGQWLRRLGVFYLRRALRIGPAYYAALALGALLPLAMLHQYPLWFVLPAANLLCYRLQTWPEGLGHYWTLALEEQFYLLWPLLLTLLQRLGKVVGGLWTIAGLGLLFRFSWVWAVGPGFVTVLLPACLDLFAAGALLRLQAPGGCGLHCGASQTTQMDHWDMLLAQFCSTASAQLGATARCAGCSRRRLPHAGCATL